MLVSEKPQNRKWKIEHSWGLRFYLYNAHCCRMWRSSENVRKDKRNISYMILYRNHVPAMTLEIWEQFSPRCLCFKAHLLKTMVWIILLIDQYVSHLILENLQLASAGPSVVISMLNIQSEKTHSPSELKFMFWRAPSCLGYVRKLK